MSKSSKIVKNNQILFYILLGQEIPFRNEDHVDKELPRKINEKKKAHTNKHKLCHILYKLKE